MTDLKQRKAILFSDIVGSSQLYASLGNTKAEERISFVIATMAGCVERFSGEVVKTIGDELMCTFENISDATDAAVEMNRLVQESQMELRTGVSAGFVLTRNKDIFGNTVNNAAFLTKLARAREIVVDAASVQDLTDTSARFDLIGEVTIKGQKKKTKIYRVNWENGLSLSLGATAIAHTNNNQKSKRVPELIIQYSDKSYPVYANNTQFIIGRDRSAVSLQISQTRVSRKHCSIYFQRGKFLLEDHSTNGTFLKQNDMTETLLRRESVPLINSGVFSLGQSTSADTVHFNYQIKL
jgi:hypothetical protein